ncbi:hypothetical protein FACS189475_00350 [Betaproteobacteria bacterium]|nr:hypothetical protein FACS189475_00350 [Betaproteobacteria bacterium]
MAHWLLRWGSQAHSNLFTIFNPVIPAKAGIQFLFSAEWLQIKNGGALRRKVRFWIPAFARLRGNDGDGVKTYRRGKRSLHRIHR